LLRSWNLAAKWGECYVFNETEGEADGELTKRVYLNTITILELYFDENNYESCYKLSEEIIEQIQIKIEK
jgi:hypothetical protein